MEKPHHDQRNQGKTSDSATTDPQRRTLKEIGQFINKHKRGFPPTIKELADILGKSHASVHDQVNQLVRKGYLKREARKARGLVVARKLDDEEDAKK